MALALSYFKYLYKACVYKLTCEWVFWPQNPCDDLAQLLCEWARHVKCRQRQWPVHVRCKVDLCMTTSDLLRSSAPIVRFLAVMDRHAWMPHCNGICLTLIASAQLFSQILAFCHFRACSCIYWVRCSCSALTTSFFSSCNIYSSICFRAIHSRVIWVDSSFYVHFFYSLSACYSSSHVNASMFGNRVIVCSFHRCCRLASISAIEATSCSLSCYFYAIYCSRASKWSNKACFLDSACILASLIPSK